MAGMGHAEDQTPGKNFGGEGEQVGPCADKESPVHQGTEVHKETEEGEIYQKKPPDGPKNPVQVEFSLSHGMIPPNVPGTIWAVIKLSAAPLKREGGEKKRLPLNIGVVLDRSGSMAGDPLKYVKEAASFVVEHLAFSDWFSLVIFDDAVQVLCPAQKVTQKDKLKAVIREIVAGGSTNLSGGFLTGYQEVLKECRNGQVNRILLLSDGQANVGITDPALLSEKARAMVERGVTVSTIGVGAAFNEDLMMGLAEAGQGHYYYVKSPEEIPQVFARELEGLLSVLAQAVKVSVRGGSDCLVTGVLGYKPEFTPDGVMVSLPDMYENDVKVLVLEIHHPPLPEGEHEVIRLVLDYTDALGALETVTLQISARLTAGVGPAGSYEPNLEVTKVVELTRAAMAKDKAVEFLDRGDHAGGEKLLEEHLEALKTLRVSLPADQDVLREVEELETMVERFRALQTEPSNAAYRVNEIRKDMRYQSYKRRRWTE